METKCLSQKTPEKMMISKPQNMHPFTITSLDEGPGSICIGPGIGIV